MLTVLLGDEGAKTWIREENPRRKTASSCVFTAQVCRGDIQDRFPCGFAQLSEIPHGF